MDELKIFDSEEFGQIRTMEVNNIPYFVANDVAKALGYKNSSDATNTHCKKAIFAWGSDSLGRRQEFKVIPEGDIYRLVVKSQLKSAEQFETWIFDEVLPALRKTGSYEITKKEKPNKKNLSSTNMLVKTVSGIFKDAGVNPLFIAAEVKRLYKEQADIDIKIPLITDKEDMPKLYDCTEMAKELGIMSASGLPHNKAVSAILSKIEITESEVVTTAFSRNGHEDVTTQYKPTVYIKVENWLKENDYPNKIPYTDSKGNYKTFSVVYREVA